MDPNNPIPSNHDQFDVKPTYIKQMIDDDANRPVDFDMDLLLKNSVCGMARNGKHDEGEYDYADIGPETDVDAGENVHDNNYPSLVASSSLDPTPESEKSLMETEKHNDDDDDDDRNDNDYSNRENANVCPVDSVVNDNDVDNRVRPSDKDVRGADDETLRDNGDNDARIETAGTHTVLDDDESPPSPRAASKCNLSVVRARLCVALVYGYAYHAVSNLFVSLTNYISNSFVAHFFGLRRKWAFALWLLERWFEDLIEDRNEWNRETYMSATCHRVNRRVGWKNLVDGKNHSKFRGLLSRIFQSNKINWQKL